MLYLDVAVNVVVVLLKSFMSVVVFVWCSICFCHTPLNHSLLLSFPAFASGDAYYLAIGGGVAEHNWNHIRTVLQDQGFHCQLTDHSEDMGMISIQGPKRWGKKRRREGMERGKRGYEWTETFMYPGEERTKRVRECKERWRGEEKMKMVTDWSKEGLRFTSWTQEVRKDELVDRREESRLRGCSQDLTIGIRGDWVQGHRRQKQRGSRVILQFNVAIGCFMML